MLNTSFQKVCTTCANKKCTYQRIFQAIEAFIDGIEETQEGTTGINFTVDVATGCDCYITLK